MAAVYPNLLSDYLAAPSSVLYTNQRGATVFGALVSSETVTNLEHPVDGLRPVFVAFESVDDGDTWDGYVDATATAAAAVTDKLDLRKIVSLYWAAAPGTSVAANATYTRDSAGSNTIVFNVEAAGGADGTLLLFMRN